jgi:hypothetical protein
MEGSSNSKNFLVAAAVFVLIAALLVIVGFDTMMTYDSGYGSSDKIVGGDAYNYIIRSNRGVGMVCAGIASAVVSTTLGLFSVRSELAEGKEK